MDVSRRKFFKICAGGMAGTTAAALGFAPKWRWLRHAISNCCVRKRDPQHLQLTAPWAAGY